MSWDEAADDYAKGDTWALREHLNPEWARGRRVGTVEGARWMREQLASPAAVERIADHLHQLDFGSPLSEHHDWCTDSNCTTPKAYRIDAEHIIKAQMGGSDGETHTQTGHR